MTALLERDATWVLGSLLLRLPILLLPALGRDEATYYLWAALDHGAYAPLMLSVVRLVDALVSDPLVATRLAAALGGCALVWALRVTLRAAGASARTVRLSSAAVVASPWFVYSAGVLHPDPLLVAALLWGLAAYVRRDPLGLGLGAVAAVLAKPSGVLVSVAALVLLAADADGRRQRPLGWATGVGLAVVSGVGGPLLLGLERFRALRWLGAAPDGDAGAVVFVWLATWVVFVGPLLIWSSGWAAFAKKPSDDRAARAWVGSRVFAGVWLMSLVSTALWGGQFKANWWAPAAVVLVASGASWPMGPLGRVFGVGSAALAVGTAVAFAWPASVEWLERHAPVRQTYALGAGAREERVSATRAWTDRVAEYRPMDEFAADARRWWGHGAPRCIVTDDYGLAAQLSLAWSDPPVPVPVPVPVAVPTDPIHPSPRAIGEGASMFVWRSPSWPDAISGPRAEHTLAHPSVAGVDVYVAREIWNPTGP